MQRQKTRRKGLILTGVFLVCISLAVYLFVWLRQGHDDIRWGVTFSASYAEDYGLSWEKTYLAILDDLKVKELRLSAYWQVTEPVPNIYDFSALDWQIAQAKIRGAHIVLAVGRRLPRWPECHIPAWAQELSEAEQQEEILELFEAVVNRYKNERAIWAWQVENEPFVSFGQCPELDEAFLEKEVRLVKRLDASRPVVVTDTANGLLWNAPARHGDIIGINVFRIKPHFYDDGTLYYPIDKTPPELYAARVQLFKGLFLKKRIMVTELQAEPWPLDTAIHEISVDEQYASMNPEHFRDTVEFFKRTGLKQAYLWGAEWWYWLKVNGHPEMWEEVKRLFR